MEHVNAQTLHDGTRSPPLGLRGHPSPNRQLVATVAKVAAISAVALLVLRCMWSLRSILGSLWSAGKRSLAAGGSESCKDAQGDRGSAGSGDESFRVETQLTAVDLQLRAIQLTDRDLECLSAEQQGALAQAKEKLRAAMEKRAELHGKVFAAHHDLSLTDQKLRKALEAGGPSVGGTTEEVQGLDTAYAALQEKHRSLLDEQEKMEQHLQQMAWTPVQQARAMTIFANALAHNRPLSQEAAAAMAAAEKIMAPDKILPTIPTPAESVRLLQLADKTVTELKRLCRAIGYPSAFSEWTAEYARQIPLAARAVKDAQTLAGNLKAVKMNESAKTVEEAVGQLEELLEAAVAKSPTSPTLQRGLEEMGISGTAAAHSTGPSAPQARHPEKQAVERRHQLLRMSRELAKALQTPLRSEKAWEDLEARFAEGLATYTLELHHDLPSAVTPDETQAFKVALSMCESSLERADAKLMLRWALVLHKHQAILEQPIMNLQRAREAATAESLVRALDSPLMDAMTQCRRELNTAKKLSRDLRSYRWFSLSLASLQGALDAFHKQIDRAQAQLVLSAEKIADAWTARLQEAIDAHQRKEAEPKALASVILQAVGIQHKIEGLADPSPEFPDFEEMIEKAKKAQHADADDASPDADSQAAFSTLRQLLKRSESDKGTS